ncbi:MAG: hypothetical protein JWO58_482 [Chitinophagaceae bacterium]|nr:hypothetical protein [Chitinophagaceae bacterium]
MYSEYFDSSTLTAEDNNLLSEFATRRAIILHFIRQQRKYVLTCPACAFPTLHHQGGFETCPVCDWVDEGQDDEEADEIWKNRNGKLSLTEYRVATGYALRTLCHEQKGSLVADPVEIIDVIEQHEARMDAFQETNSMNVDDDHPVWEAWKKEKAKLKLDLIRK